MKTSLSSRGSHGFTLVEVMVTMSIAMLGMGLALSTFMTGFKTMYRDGQRLATNANLRYVIAHLAQETLDASEFYLFGNYTKLDGSVNLTADIAGEVEDAYGADLRHGDCLVLVTRVTIDDTSNVRQFRIYYRDTADVNAEGALRYYESQDWGTSGTTTALATLLNNVNLNANPKPSTTRVISAKTRGRLKSGSTTECWPIFSSDSASATTYNESVAVNVEVITGTSVNHTLASSSFNYTISPRK